MDREAVFNAAKSTSSMATAYVMAVAQKYGQQEAFDLLSSAYQQFGKQAGEMLKQQLEGKELNAQNIFEVIAPMFESLGFEFEKTEDSTDKVTVKIPRCPSYEACQEVGAPAAEFCKYMAEPLMNGIAKAINPKAAWKYLKRRESADDYCIEQIVIE